MTKKGFTLVELLVTITIIILLSSVAFISYQSSTRKARDNKRKADLEQMRAALEMYKSDNDVYPNASSFADMATVLTSGGYLTTTPTDPKSSSGYIYYYNRTSTITYDLCAYFESSGYSDDCGDNCGHPEGSSCNYKLTNP
jgi:general secretion pathway protein G